MNKIIEIATVECLKLGNHGKLQGNNKSQLGVGDMINALRGYGEYDGYKVKTEKDVYLVLISNGQSCCEEWGYFDTNDDSDSFIGAGLKDIELVDMALNIEKYNEKIQYGLDDGGICFVNFITDKGVFQLAVYNAHNGYYGHSILIAKNEDILNQDIL